MALERDERTRLGARQAQGLGQGLGQGAVIGRTVWDVQHKFRIIVGPMRIARYVSFLPGGDDLARLQAMVRQWVGLEFEWDVQLVLAREDVPRLRLGRVPGSAAGMLGRTAWLGRRRRTGDAGDLILDVERTLRAGRRR
jgi:type VI secretion system protein ImpH